MSFALVAASCGAPSSPTSSTAPPSAPFSQTDLLVGDGAARELRLGRDLPARRRWPHRVAPEGRRARCYGPDGRLIALLVATAIPDVWHPYRVLPADPAGATNSAKKALETAAEVIDI